MVRNTSPRRVRSIQMVKGGVVIAQPYEHSREGARRHVMAARDLLERRDELPRVIRAARPTDDRALKSQ